MYKVGEIYSIAYISTIMVLLLYFVNAKRDIQQYYNSDSVRNLTGHNLAWIPVTGNQSQNDDKLDPKIFSKTRINVTTDSSDALALIRRQS